MAREYETNPRGHTWQLDEDGKIDIFAYDGDTHNGPACVTCGYSFCHHCTRGRALVECKNPDSEGGKHG